MSEGDVRRAYFCLGSNIQPEQNLPAAVAALAELGRVVRVSRVWESPPAGFFEQANFLNAAVLLQTVRSAAELCDAAKRIEGRLGRVRDSDNKNGPRTIDIDLALFNGVVADIAGRTIPDPDILARAFVTVPLAELDPTYRHPLDGRTLSEIADELSGKFTLTLRPDVALGRQRLT